MVAVPGLGGAAPPAVRRPTFDVTIGSSPADTWRPHVAALLVSGVLGPDVGAASVVIAGDGAPGVEPGDPATVALGFTHSGTTLVMTGHVAAVTETLDGTRRITVHDAAADLARFRLDQSYVQQNAGEVVRDLATRAGVTIARADAGATYPSVVVDGRHGAWRHIAALARRSGLLARIDAAGHLVVAPPDTASVVTLDPTSEVLDLRATRWHDVPDAVSVIGEGAAGAHGADAWAWLVCDASSVTADAGGSGGVRVGDPALRSPDAVRAAAEAELTARQRLASTCRVRLAGLADVRPGGTVEVAGGPGGGLAGAAAGALPVGAGGQGGGVLPGAGRWLVTTVRHRLAGAFTTDLTLVGTGEPGPGASIPSL
jgi:phage protein D